MKTTLILLSSLLSLTLSLSKPNPSPNSAISQACGSARYPDACYSTLSTRVKPDSNLSEVIQAAFSASAENLKTGRKMVKNILLHSSGNLNRSQAALTCLEGLSFSKYRTNASIRLLGRAGRLKDARAWTSAALAHQFGCWSGLKYVNNITIVNTTMSFFNDTLIISTSNALSMLQALDAGSWGPPRTERDGFWEPVFGPGPGFGLMGPEIGDLKEDVTVCKDGGVGGCLKTVQEAVDKAEIGLKGRRRYVIRIKEGVYDENVNVWFNKSNLVFVGDGIGKTVISGSLNAGMKGYTTYETATVGVLGDGFMATGITFQNTAPPPTHQAVAFRSSSDRSYIENCEFLGNQDTLYVHSLRQFYKSCHIEGNVDFIFGGGAAIFENCTILVRPRQVDPEKGEKNSVAAHGRSDPAQTTGFVFSGCFINGTEDYMKLYQSKPSVHLNYLARPWKMYSRTVFIDCVISEVIDPEGWMPWDGDFALETLYYGEFGNSGLGANLSSRVSWSSRIPEEHVSAYDFGNFLQGDEWVTSTR